MSPDLELEAWRRQWQEQEGDSIPADLRRKVDRHSRLMKIGLICDTVVTLVMGGGTTAWAVLSKDSAIGLVAVATWLFLAAAWAIVLTVNRGLWAPSAVDAAVFMDLSIRRCQAALIAVWFAGVLFVAEIVFGLSWAYLHSAMHTSVWKWLLFGSLRIDIVWGCTIAFFGTLVWYRNKKMKELVRLLSLHDEMTLTADTGVQGEGRHGQRGWRFAGRGLKRWVRKKGRV